MEFEFRINSYGLEKLVLKNLSNKEKFDLNYEKKLSSIKQIKNGDLRNVFKNVKR